MKIILELYVEPKEYLILRFYQKEFKIKFLYKFLAKILTANIKKNIFFLLNSDEFKLLNKFKNIDISDIDFQGYDKNSIAVLKSILFKIKSIYSVKRFLPYLKFYTKADKEKINELNNNFYNHILKNKQGYYQYKSYTLPINHFEPSVIYYKHGIGELSEESLNKIKNADIIDAGGYIGDSALVLSEYTNKNIYSFECCTEQFNLMQKTIELNSKKNIIPVKLALGNTIEKSKINIYSSACLNTIINNDNYNIQKNSEEINITTLDNFVEQNNLKVGLIKADIEGMEQNLILGSINIIRKFKPVLIISIYHSTEDFLKIKPMIDNLNLGYVFKIYKPFDGCVINDLVLIAQCDFN